VSHYGCKYVVHGDDITTDSNGEDCYRFVKEAGRFLVVKRTPGISTTDLVGRMLLFTKGHFISDLGAYLLGEKGHLAGDDDERHENASQMRDRIKEYATDSTGKNEWVDVWTWDPIKQPAGPNGCTSLIRGVSPLPFQRVVYVDGSFDLFSSGHIEFLKQVVSTEESHARISGWYNESKVNSRIQETGQDYGPVYVIAGIHDDYVVNKMKGSNYPIMNVYERSLCVLQCKVSKGFYTCHNYPNTTSLLMLWFTVPHSSLQKIFLGVCLMDCQKQFIMDQPPSCQVKKTRMLMLNQWKYSLKYHPTNTSMSTLHKLFSVY
jgi:ethanolamine-phosphate cytidylyltransferase